MRTCRRTCRWPALIWVSVIFLLVFRQAAAGEADSGDTARGGSVLVRAGETVARDAKHILSAPLRMDAKDVLALGGAVAAVGGVMLMDDDIRDWSQRQRTDTLDHAADALDVI